MDKNLLQKIANYYGIFSQMHKLIEESGEPVQATVKAFSGSDDAIDHLAGERKKRKVVKP